MFDHACLGAADAIGFVPVNISHSAVCADITDGSPREGILGLERGPIGREGDRHISSAMAGQYRCAGARGHVPDPFGVVTESGHETGSIAGEGEGGDPEGLARRYRCAGPRCHIPDPHGHVLGCGREAFSVVGEGDGGDFKGVSS